MLMMMPPLLRYFWFHSVYSVAASCSLQSASAVCSLQMSYTVVGLCYAQLLNYVFKVAVVHIGWHITFQAKIRPGKA